ncbi:hypothetical protein [Ponticaulis profundi]|uniref:Uncharacterized protein n=1 Tax=Ponticaulis profundi TaxID=2665222 RepID=A0ABW1SBZ8_9PROT
MTNDPFRKAGQNGWNVPTNNDPGALASYRQGQNDAFQKRQEEQRRFNDWYNK